MVFMVPNLFFLNGLNDLLGVVPNCLTGLHGSQPVVPTCQAAQLAICDKLPFPPLPWTGNRYMKDVLRSFSTRKLYTQAEKTHIVTASLQKQETRETSFCVVQALQGLYDGFVTCHTRLKIAGGTVLPKDVQRTLPCKLQWLNATPNDVSC
jgi:hypothetical protein